MLPLYFILLFVGKHLKEIEGLTDNKKGWCIGSGATLCCRARPSAPGGTAKDVWGSLDRGPVLVLVRSKCDKRENRFEMAKKLDFHSACNPFSIVLVPHSGSGLSCCLSQLTLGMKLCTLWTWGAGRGGVTMPARVDRNRDAYRIADFTHL